MALPSCTVPSVTFWDPSRASTSWPWMSVKLASSWLAVSSPTWLATVSRTEVPAFSTMLVSR